MFAHGQRQPGLGQDRLQQGLHFGIELLGAHHTVDQAAPLRLGRVNEATSDQHLHRLLGLHIARERHARRGAEQSHVDAVDPQAHAFGGHRQIALGHQLAACRSGDALHAGDDRHRQAAQRHHHAGALRKELLVIGQLRSGLHFLEVVPGAKGLAFGSEHHGARRLIGRHAGHRLLQGVKHGFA